MEERKSTVHEKQDTEEKRQNQREGSRAFTMAGLKQEHACPDTV